MLLSEDHSPASARDEVVVMTAEAADAEQDNAGADLL